MASNTIKLAVYGIPPVELEAIAGENIYCGQLANWENTNVMVRLNTGVGGHSNNIIAVESLLDGKSIGTEDIGGATYYAVGETGTFIQARPGDVMWLWLQGGESVNIGDRLISVGNGNVAAQSGNEYIVGTALETINAVVLTRIKVEIS